MAALSLELSVYIFNIRRRSLDSLHYQHSANCGEERTKQSQIYTEVTFNLCCKSRCCIAMSQSRKSSVVLVRSGEENSPSAANREEQFNIDIGSETSGSFG